MYVFGGSGRCESVTELGLGFTNSGENGICICVLVAVVWLVLGESGWVAWARVFGWVAWARVLEGGVVLSLCVVSLDSLCVVSLDYLC